MEEPFNSASRGMTRRLENWDPSKDKWRSACENLVHTKLYFQSINLEASDVDNMKKSNRSDFIFICGDFDTNPQTNFIFWRVESARSITLFLIDQKYRNDNKVLGDLVMFEMKIIIHVVDYCF